MNWRRYRSDMDVGCVHPWVGLAWVGLEPPTKKVRVDPFVDLLMMLQPLNRRLVTFMLKMNSLATRHCVFQLPGHPHCCTGKNKPLIIRSVARRLFSISASSAQSERDFSAVGRTVTDSRSQLAVSKVEAIELVRWGLRAGLI